MLTIYQQKYKGQGAKGKNISYAVLGVECRVLAVRHVDTQKTVTGHL